MLKSIASKPASKKYSQGQSLVEFAVMLIFLVTLLLGVLDLGRAFFTYLALKDAAADGVYFAAAYPRCVDGPSGGGPEGNDTSDDTITNTAGALACRNPNNIEYRARQSAPAGGLVDWTFATVTLEYADPVSYTAGTVVTISVSYKYQLLTPVIGAIVGSQEMTLYAQSVGIIIINSLPE